jgi:tripartite-type tricarboxylate transporter receptor subunit TctC
VGSYLKTAEAKERLLGAGMEVVASSPEHLSATMKHDIARMSKIIKSAGIRE